MNIELVSSFGSLVDCKNEGKLMLKPLLGILKSLVAVLDQLSSILTPTTAMDQENYCRVCLDHVHNTLKYLRMSSPETFICLCNRNFQNKPTVRTGKRPNDSHRRKFNDDVLFATDASALRIRVIGNAKPRIPDNLTSTCNVG